MEKQLLKITKIGRIGENDSNFGESSSYHIGYFTGHPKVGEQFRLQGFSFEKGKEGIITSLVTEIIDFNTFKTKNSIYKIENYETT